MNAKPASPVKPKGMELIFIYSCPFCQREVPLVAPTSPAVVRCDVCTRTFPVIPIEEKTVSFIKLMLGNGASAIDADFM